MDNDNVFKMGHGGTLDPMATGVLIVGIGRGTKFLQNFLDCTKTYETVVLFGKSTDTYDVAGKVVASADTTQIDRKLVEEKLEGFRGRIKQIPPIYSALKIDGMKAYDYARSGKALPRELAARDMEVAECVLTDWYEPGKHEFRWPAAEAPEQERNVFKQLVHREEIDNDTANTKTEPVKDSRKEAEDTVKNAPEVQEIVRSEGTEQEAQNALSKEEKAARHTHTISGLAEKAADAPAARVRLTVSSGFYVRSFAHDLGLACGSYGTMAELARTRQADYSTASPTPDSLIPALDHTDIASGEDVWGPKITKVLEAWLDKNPAPITSNTNRRDNRSFDRRPTSRARRDDGGAPHKRRNSSSPEA